MPGQHADGSTMPTLIEAFSVGYGLQMVGAYFEGAPMLARIGAGAPAELKELAQDQIKALTQQGETTRWHIKRVGKAAAGAGLAAPKAPSRIEDYAGWVEAVNGPFYEKLDSDALVAAYLAGWHVGAWIQQANLAVIALFLKDAAPDRAETLEELEGLKASLAESRAGVEGVLEGAPLPEAAAEPCARIVEIVREAPAVDDASQEVLDVADDIQEALADLTEVVEKLEKALEAG